MYNFFYIFTYIYILSLKNNYIHYHFNRTTKSYLNWIKYWIIYVSESARRCDSKWRR